MYEGETLDLSRTAHLRGTLEQDQNKVRQAQWAVFIDWHPDASKQNSNSSNFFGQG